MRLYSLSGLRGDDAKQVLHTVISIDEQVRLVCLFRLQKDNFLLFLCQKETNKLLFARRANRKRIKENRQSFRFMFSI